MPIAIEVPSVECKRCHATAALEPTVLRRIAAEDKAKGGVFVATDTEGRAWAVAAEKPKGWLALADDELGQLLCETCAADFRAFLQPPVVTAPTPPPPGTHVVLAPPPPPRIAGPIPQAAPARSTVAVVSQAAPHVSPVAVPAERPVQVQRHETAAKPTTVVTPLPAADKPAAVVQKTLVAEPQPHPPLLQDTEPGEVLTALQRRT